MNEEQMKEKHQGLVNQLRLDLLLRGLGPTVLRRNFKEIYAKLNDGKGWTNGRMSGERFCRSKWGKEAFDNANVQQQLMMKEGNIQKWDLHCLQSVITQMLKTALKDRQESKNSKGTPVNWDPRWWGHMAKIRQLANIRNSVAHMPNEILSQGEFEEKWDNAVDALKGLGAKSKEIQEILQMCQLALNPPGQGQQGHRSNYSHGQKEVGNGKKQIKPNAEESKIVEELQAKIEDLQLQIQVKSQDQIENQGQNMAMSQGKIENQDTNKVHDQGNNKHGINMLVPKKNEVRADSRTTKGDIPGRSGGWDKVMEFYSRALEIPDISGDLRWKILLDRSTIHQKVLKYPKIPLNVKFNHSGSEDFDIKQKSSSKLPIPSQTGQFKLVDKKFLKVDHQNWPLKTSLPSPLKTMISLSPKRNLHHSLNIFRLLVL